MRNLKRVLTIALAAVMLVAALAVGASAAGTKFSDVNAKDEELYKAVTLLEGLGITKGTSDTTFGTNEDVTREQMAAFIYRLMKAGKSLEGGENTTPFEDLYDDTYYGMVSWANSMGIIKGISATEFNPDGGITLQDAYTMLVRALGYEKTEVLGYPYDYINIAESKDVDLGNGLPSKVSYTTELTRGNVAVLLYNAFYAETGVKKTVQKERLLGEGDNAKYILETVEEYPRLCEEVYEVIEESFTVVETTHYAFNENADSTAYKPTEDSAGAGTMFLAAVENNQKVSGFYATADQLGFEGNPDSYIMSEVTVFYTYDEKEKTVDEILFAEALIDKQSANAASYGSIDAERTKNDPENFYTAANSEWARMDGSMVVAGKQLYFYDAPYKFMEPSYSGAATEEERYALRNEDNTKLIELKCLDIDKGLYTWYIVETNFKSKDSNNELAKQFNQIRTGGIYKIDIYDPDGDGRYEYMWYKPASFGKIVMDDDYDFSDYKAIVNEENDSTNPNDLTIVPTLYANGATVVGVPYNDEDFVIAYVNGEANLIDVIGVAQGKKGMITSYNNPTGTVTLGNQSFRTCYQFLFVKGFYKYDNDTSATQNSGSANTSMFPYLYDTACLGTEVIFYTYNHGSNGVYFYEIVSGGSAEYAGDSLIIPIEAETEMERDAKTFEVKQYLKVIMDGEEKYISVDVEECYPAPKKTASGTYLFDNVVTDENGKKYNVYLNKLCTYEVDSKGNYAIRSLLHGEDEDGDFDHIDLVFEKKVFLNEKKTNQAANDLGIVNNDEEVLLKKLSGRYSILDANDTDYSMLGTYGDDDGTDYWFDDAVVDAETVFIIRTITDDDEDGENENEITTYTGLSFPGSTTTPLSNVQYIYENYGDSSKRAKLVLFYGETYGDLEFDSGISKTGYRVVKSVTPTKVDEDEFRYSYDVLNLSTGALEEGILGTVTRKNATDLAGVASIPAGSIIELNKNSKVDDKNIEILGTINVDSNANLVKFVDIVLEDNVLSVVDANNTEDEEGEIYELDEEVEISLIKFGKKNDYETAEISKLEVADLGEDGKDLLCYNSKYVDPEDDDAKVEMKYAKYIKAYIVYDQGARDDFPVIETIVVIVNDGEDAELLDLKK